MGRAKVKLELIPKVGPRMVTFKKRKDCLKKKVKELTTLCDVKAFMVIYGPDPATQPDIYPDNLNEACRVIADYNSKEATKSFGLSDFVKEKKIKEEKYPTWNETLEAVGDPLVLRKFVDELNVKAEIVKSRIELLKQDVCSSSSCTTAVQQYESYDCFDGSGLTSSFQHPPNMTLAWPELQPQCMDFPMTTNLQSQLDLQPQCVDFPMTSQLDVNEYLILEQLPQSYLNYYHAW